MIRIRFVSSGAWPSIALMKYGFLKVLKDQYHATNVQTGADITIYENEQVLQDDTSRLKIFLTGENTVPRNAKSFDIVLGFKSEQPNDYYLPAWTFYINWDASAIDDPLCISHVFPERRKLPDIPNGFCSFVSMRSRPYRTAFVSKLSQTYKSVACGGSIMNNINAVIGPTAKDKQQFLQCFKFCIAFENESVDTNMIGYTSEKIFEAFAAGVVPIYWGDPTITSIFNPKAFLNRHDFTTDENFINEIIRVDQNDQLYRAMTNEPIFLHNQIPLSFYPQNVCMKLAELYHTKK